MCVEVDACASMCLLQVRCWVGNRWPYPHVKSSCQQLQRGKEVPEVGAHQVAGAVAFCSSDLPSGEFSVVENANP